MIRSVRPYHQRIEPTKWFSHHLNSKSRYSTTASEDVAGGQPVDDFAELLNPTNTKRIEENIKSRKGIGDIDEVIRLHHEATKSGSTHDWSKFKRAALLIPNTTSKLTPVGSTPREVIASDFAESTSSCSFLQAVQRKWNLIKFGDTHQTSPALFGPRSYFLFGSLARLERTLVQWALDRLRKKGWQYVGVPDQLPETIINSCGFVTTGKQNQVFKLREKDFYTNISHNEDRVDDTNSTSSASSVCLAGTAEVSLAGLYLNTAIDVKSLPVKVVAFSRCFRAEEAKNRIDKNFYRLYEFTKVEMFAITDPSDSDRMFEEILETQRELVEELKLDYRLLEMPTEELGASAHRKCDIEAWMPAKKHWGEITSASNCTLYQSRRLGIRDSNGNLLHTLNGTAAAIPRLLISLVEQGLASSGLKGHKLENSPIKIPDCLSPYFGNITELELSPLTGKTRRIPSRRWSIVNFWDSLGKQC